MRRFQLTLLAAGLPAFVLALTLTGCGGGDRDPDDDLPPRQQGGSLVSAKTREPLNPVGKPTDYRGTLSGKVVWSGDADFADLTKSLHRSVDASPDKNKCLAEKAKDYEKNQQTYRVGKNGWLGNVHVWIVPPKGHYFIVSEKQVKELPREVRISQPHCAFVPHCTLHVPVYYKDGEQQSTEQKLVIDNFSEMGHNASLDPGGNRTIPKGGQDIFKLSPSRTPVILSCNVHGWMKGYIRVLDHPYGAITSVGRNEKDYENMADPKVGTYEITGVPVGAKVRLFAWHEAAGFLGPTAGEEITLGEKTTKDFPATRK